MVKKDVKVVIPCGGQGTRLREHTVNMPKPLVPIGGKPILEHIMKGYSSQGYNNFVLCLGYKGNMIKDYFINHQNYSSDIRISSRIPGIEYLDQKKEDWEMILANTGEKTQTAGRIKRIEEYLKDDEFFMLTYGDGVGDIDINKVLEFHKEKGKTVTITGVKPHSRYGLVEIDEDGIAKKFVEKPYLDDTINAGYMVINRGLLHHPLLDDETAIEEVLADLTKNREVAVYKHDGFWHSMDTHRDYQVLNDMWDSGETPWKTWK